MPDYRLIEVKNAKDFSRWLDFTDRLYPNGFFIPPIRQNLQRFFECATPYQKQDMEVKFFLVEDARNNAVARTTCHRSLKFNRKMSSDVQLFGFTEFIDDMAVFRFLFSELKLAARNAKRKMLLGPANFLPNQFGGVMTGGFDCRGFVDNVYNHPYYPKFYKDFGFEGIFDSQTFICERLDGPALDASKVFPFDEERMKLEGLHVCFGQRSRFVKEQLPVLLKMLNSSFDELKYYTNISEEELKFQTDGLEYIMDNELFLYLTKQGRPVAFILCIPDLSEFIVRIKGNLNALNLFHLLLTRSRYKREAILLIKGTVPDEAGKGYMGLLHQKLLRNLKTLGYRNLRSTWVQTQNKASAEHFLRMNGRVLHDISFFKMDL